ncbi:MAG: methyltransferase domain-containing protein, partial [Pyrinomonadaceae bacterium]
MLPKNSDQNWETYGKDNPYFGVLSDEKFMRAQLDEQAIDEFFATGETHIAEVMATIDHHLAADFSPKRCLDFGCGVGRLVFPLAQRFGFVTGVDISPSMLAEARKNADGLGLTNVELLPSDDTLSQVTGPFDLI